MSSRPDAAGSYYIETWGCQMNVLDAAKLSGALEQHGYRRVEHAEQADVVLLNTCAIREKAEEKVYSELGRLRPLKEARPDLVRIHIQTVLRNEKVLQLLEGATEKE